MYKIFLDQNKTFQCSVQLEGAELSKSEARLFLESENFTLAFKGEINTNGTVKIPIKKLKGILTENYSGKIYLEVIAEDTVFKPWESDYVTDVAKKVSVQVENESKFTESIKEEYTPKMKFSIIPDEFDTKLHLNEIHKILTKNNVSKKSLLERKNQEVFNKLVETYCNLNFINDSQHINSLKRDLLHNIK
jgi:hypothetical protein